MTADPELAAELAALIERTPGAGRPQVEELIASVIAAGGVSEHALLRLLSDREQSASLRSGIAWLLPRLGFESADASLAALLLDPDESIRQAAAVGLGLVLQDDEVDLLLEHLQRESSQPVRAAVLHALGIISSSRSADAVMSILRDRNEDDELRADAAEALAHVRHDAIVDLLVDALRDRSPLVRYSAAYALGEQKDRSALPALRDATADDAATPWGSVGARASESVELLEQSES